MDHELNRTANWLGISFLNFCFPTIVFAVQRFCQSTQVTSDPLERAQLRNQSFRAQTNPILTFGRSPHVGLESGLSDADCSLLRSRLVRKVKEELNGVWFGEI